jgi:TRAP transporter TAXI family solute receptor
VLAAAATAALGAGLAAVTLPDRGPDRPAALVVATGPQGAVFLEVGRDLARAAMALSPGTRVSTLVTAATVDNLRLLATGRADLALASLDAAAGDPRVATRGADGGVDPRGGILAVSRLYDSFLHLVVPAASEIRDVSGCAGRRIGLGASGSGTEFTGLRLLSLAGIRPASTVRLGQSDAMAALLRGTIDATFSLTGFPTPAISDLAARTAIRLVPLGGELDRLDRAAPGVYRSGAVPAGTYPEVPATETVYVPNLLLARPHLPDAAVSLTIEALLSARSRRYWVHPDSRRIDVRTAIATGPVPLHPAAVAWLRATKP